MFILQLNDMRSANVENIQFVARAETKEELEQFLEREKTEVYIDSKWSKNFRAGGPLEWFNPPYSFDKSILSVGTAASWVNEAIRQFDVQIMSIPTIP